MAGVETVDGREVVRVAWFAYRNDGNGGGGLRGLLWVAPSLGFAVVRSEASQDPSQAGMTHGRRAWRKTSSDFVEVGGLWLPRKVEARFAEANPDGTPSHAPRELVATIEDYRVNPELPPDTFHPKFKIEALDEQTGQFTTCRPSPPPGLVDRLKRAVAECPFGPPRSTPRPPSADAHSRRAAGRRERPTAGRARSSPTRRRRAAPARRSSVPRPRPGRRHAGGRPIASQPGPPDSTAETPIRRPSRSPSPPPGPRREPTIPEPTPSRPATADPAPNRASRPTSRASPEEARSADRARSSRPAGDRPGLADGGGAGTSSTSSARIARVAGDPAVRKAQKKLQGPGCQYDQLWEVEVAARSASRSRPSRSAEEPATRSSWSQSRRDGKAAEVQKAEAQRDLAKAVVDRNAGPRRSERTSSARRRSTKAEAELKVAEAELAGKKAELDEADLLLNQARRRLGPAPRPRTPSRRPRPSGRRWPTSATPSS